MTAGHALPLEQAAQVLGVRPGTLRRWVREGCPTACPGRRGRGHALLIDPTQVRQWREAGDRQALAMELASALPEVMAAATEKAWMEAEGIDRRRLAGVMAASWYLAACSVLDALRNTCPSVPDVGRPLPEAIERLEKIARN